MNRDVMSVRLWLPLMVVLGVVVDAPERLWVRVGSAVRRPACPDCGAPSGTVHDRREKRVRDLEVSGRPVTLLWDRRRMVCESCGRRFLEVHRALVGRVTARLARRLAADARETAVNAAARRHRVGWHLVMALVIAYAGLVGDHRRRRRCRVLLVDETSIRKRHRYVTVLAGGGTGEVLAMVPHRSEAALSGFLAAQGHRWQKGVKVVVSDGSKPYAAAIAKRLGHARHVLDRFHVIRWFAAGLTAVRRDVQRRPEGSKPAFDPAVFRARFALTKRPDTLDDAERERLDALFETHPRLKAAWDALGELHGLYLAKDRKGALEALDRFADIYGTGDIPESGSTVDAFLAWHKQILDWHHTGRPSNGRIDRTNNLLQVLRRRAHGFTSHANFEARGILITQPHEAEPSSPIPRFREGSTNLRIRRDGVASFAFVMRFLFEAVPESDKLLTMVADGTELLTLDLSRVRFVKPSLLVVVAAIASAHRLRHGVPLQLVPPSLRDPRVYASRMSLGAALAAEGVASTGLEPVQHHDRQERLCELTRFESNAEAAALVDLVQQRCDAAGYPHAAAEALGLSIWELTDNCLAHARAGSGFLAAQVLPQPAMSLHFAVADGGIGIRASLAGTSHERSGDEAAIMAAVQSRVTSVASLQSRARGIGLPNLLGWVTAAGGVLTIRSGVAAISYRHNADSAAPYAVPSAVEEIGGTLVSGWIPC